MSDEVSRVDAVQAAKQAKQIERADERDARQEAMKEDMQSAVDYTLYGQQERKFKTAEERLTNPNEVAKTKKGENKGQLKDSGEMRQIAQQVEAKNPELKAKTLMIIREHIGENDTPEEIQQKVSDAVKDPWLADETIDFLIETTVKGSDHAKNLERAKEQHTTIFDREIKAGRNMAAQSVEFSKAGLGTPTSLRDIYRDITGNPRQPLQLFTELMSKFDFEKMKQVIDFVLHSLGSDMKAKGPSIPRGELQNMFSSARSMQSIMGVFRFFKGRMSMIEGQFKRGDLIFPSRLTFNYLAEIFMKLITERYPSPDKVLRLAQTLGISEELAAQIIIFTAYRDALRGVSPRLFRSERQRQDLLTTILDALSELDDLLEDEDDDDDEEEEEDDLPLRRRTKDTMESLE